MSSSETGVFIDKDVRALLDVVHKAAAGGKRQQATRSLFDPTLHPRGIKELAAPPAMRIASALVDLLGTLEDGDPSERLRALRAVREEVLHNSSQVFRINTARVLLEVMKDLVRVVGDEPHQVALARDFIDATSGQPRHVRQLLRRYHLLEMPEDWSQVAYDHRVHDANSTGRKTPTHLIMDAWIKGIRFLGVVYYNHVPQAAAAELLEAADIMGVNVRIGIEVSTRFRGAPARLILFSRGYQTRRDYLAHLESPAVQAFMAEGRQVTDRVQAHVIALLHRFNERDLPVINREMGIEMAPIQEAGFREMAGTGQASRMHLAEYIHSLLMPHLAQRVEALSAECGDCVDHPLVQAMNALVPEEIKVRYLSTAANPDLPDPLAPTPDAPAILKMSPSELLDRVATLPVAERVVLSPTGLSAADVLEILYRGGGRITHLELFSLRDQAEERVDDLARINRIRRVLNAGHIIELKRVVLEILREVEDDQDRAARIRAILGDLPRFLSYYSEGGRLHSRISTGSTGRSRVSRGMGLVVVPSLGGRARRRVFASERRLPVQTTVMLRVTHEPRTRGDRLGWLRGVPVFRNLAFTRTREWAVAHNATHFIETPGALGNIATLGGVPEEQGNRLRVEHPVGRLSRLRWRALPAPVRQLAKVGIGFLPAFLTFWLTQDWWFLAWFGAPVWFAITGLRNVIQSVVGGGGLSRSPLLRWNDLVSWNRVADSLLFTGFSVPLLDYLVKHLLLDQTFGVTVTSAPWLLYTVIALANGVYISSHNLFRGLPTAAIIGNFFRSVLSIPVAFGLSALIGHLLVLAGVPVEQAQGMLQLSAAVISKAASDTVAGIIEGTADRALNVRRARRDFTEKLRQLSAVQGRLELLFPEEDDVLALLDRPKRFVRALQAQSDELIRAAIINALDLMYFWYYHPRAQTVFRQALAQMSEDERRVLLGLQGILERKRVVSEMFLSGLVGRSFERPLGFYLNRVDGYLSSIRRVD